MTSGFTTGTDGSALVDLSSSIQNLQAHLLNHLQPSKVQPIPKRIDQILHVYNAAERGPHANFCWLAFWVQTANTK